MTFGIDLWKIVLESNCSEETERDIKIGLDDLYAKAKAFDELKKHIDEEVDSYMALYRQTKDPIYSLLNSHYDTLLGFVEELERADDER
ncbi:hypothetical protein QI300_11200 [Staphylococcus saprophyticus]|nr:hypothetical protein [Staphylococcus saprophyticus]MDW4036082.1 hypothetical protein [Staphylococcus saprophyticus]